MVPLPGAAEAHMERKGLTQEVFLFLSCTDLQVRVKFQLSWEVVSSRKSCPNLLDFPERGVLAGQGEGCLTSSGSGWGFFTQKSVPAKGASLLCKQNLFRIIALLLRKLILATALISPH